MKTQIELIEYYSAQLKKVLISHGPESEHFVVVFYQLQGAKMGIPLNEMFDWANTEAERLKVIALDKL